MALAAAAGVAIENARLYEEAHRRERWLAATAEITGLLSRVGCGDRRSAGRGRPGPGASRGRRGLAGGRGRRRAVSAPRWSPGPPVTARRCSRAVPADSRWPARSSGPANPSRSRTSPHDPRAVDVADARWAGHGSARRSSCRCAAPADVDGVLALAWRPSSVDAFHAVDPGLPASFAEQAALALQVARSRDDRAAAGRLRGPGPDRAGPARPGDPAALRGRPRPAERCADRRTEPRGHASGSSSAVDDLDATIKDIRRSIFALGLRGLGADIQAEVTRIVDRAAATLKFRPTLELDGPVRTTVTGRRRATPARRPRRGAVERDTALRSVHDQRPGECRRRLDARRGRQRGRTTR